MRKNAWLMMRSRSGAAYVLAIVTLVVGLVVALAMLRFVGADYRYETSEIRKQAAANLAEAGVDWAIWQIEYKGRNVPFAADVNLSEGTAHVEVTDDSSRAESSVLITSTGMTGQYRKAIMRSISVLPYFYAWCQNSSLEALEPITIAFAPGGMRVNGDISLLLSGITIASGAWATGSISTLGLISPKYPNSPAVKFPEIIYDYYSANASVTLSDGAVLNDLSPAGSGVIFVYGDVVLDGGEYDGVFTIVATGTIYINGSFTRANSQSFCALVTSQQIIIEASASSVDAVLYCHNSDNSGVIDVRAVGSTIGGCLASDIIQTNGLVTVERNLSLTRHVMAHLCLPGIAYGSISYGGGAGG